MATVTVSIRPKPKPRPRVAIRGRFPHIYMPGTYRKWQDELRRGVGQAFSKIGPGKLAVHIVMMMKVAASMSKPKRAKLLGKHCAARTVDVDNGLGAVMDALFPDGDERIVIAHVEKYWADEDALIIGIKEIGPLDEVRKYKPRKKKNEKPQENEGDVPSGDGQPTAEPGSTPEVRDSV